MFRSPASPLINSPWRWTRSTSRGSPLLHTLPQVDHDDDDDQYSYDVKMMVWGIGFCAQCDAHIFAAKALERPLAPWWWGGDQHCCIIAIFHHDNHIIISIPYIMITQRGDDLESASIKKSPRGRNATNWCYTLYNIQSQLSFSLSSSSCLSSFSNCFPHNILLMIFSLTLSLNMLLDILLDMCETELVD